MRQINSGIRLALFAGMFSLLVVPELRAQANKIGYTQYYFSDSGKNTVVTTAFDLAKQILSRTVFLLDIELDQVSVPPVDGITGATRPQRKKSETFEKTRGQVIVGVEQGLGSLTSIAVNFYRSQEVDYLSNSAIVTFSQDLFQRNTTITIRGQINEDKVGKITESGDVVNQKKTVYTGAVHFTQLLSATTVFDVTYDAVIMKGFLSDPYRQVKIFNQNGVSELFDENHPEKRFRQAVTGKISQFITPINASLIGSYRFYHDDWRVSSHMAEIKLNKYIFSDLIFGSSYRYYTQTGAEFYQNRYTESQLPGNGYFTSDYKLMPFHSNTFGLSLSYLLRGLDPDGKYDFLRKSAIEFTWFRYFNDLDFTADIFQGSINFSI